jgi:LacI family transcriptional regulator
MLASRRVAGIIFVGTRPLAAEDNAHVVELARRVPVMLINDRLDSEYVSFVMTNREQGMGWREYLFGSATGGSLSERQPPFTNFPTSLEGFTAAMQRLGLDMCEGGVQAWSHTRGRYGGIAAGAAPLAPTAVVTAIDHVAIGAMCAVFEAGGPSRGTCRWSGFPTPVSAEIYRA